MWAAACTYKFQHTQATWVWVKCPIGFLYIQAADKKRCRTSVQILVKSSDQRHASHMPGSALALADSRQQAAHKICR